RSDCILYSSSTRRSSDLVMFQSNFNRIKFVPEDGMKVLVTGRIEVYEQTGKYQINIETMQPDGVGALYQAYEQLKAKLAQEGVRSEEHTSELQSRFDLVC